jgi:alcohol dehydrogenase class IV
VEGRPLVALGGGRVIDTAKAIGGADGLPVAAIPTTLSGAEMTRFHRMPAGFDGWRLTRPSVVVADSNLMASAPMPGLAASAMNALAHAMEALYTTLANPVASGAALRAASELSGGLEDEEPDRDRLALGALLAGYATGSAGLAVHHIVCQTIVRVCGTPHAETNAVMLPHFARMMERNAPEPMAAFGDAVGAGEGGAADRVAQVAARSGVTRLTDLGVAASALPSVVEAVGQRPDLANSPGPPTLDDVRAVLEAAL